MLTFCCDTVNHVSCTVLALNTSVLIIMTAPGTNKLKITLSNTMKKNDSSCTYYWVLFFQTHMQEAHIQPQYQLINMHRIFEKN